MREIWKPLPDEPLYEASNLGNVRSWNGLGAHAGKRQKEPRLLAQREGPNTYLQVELRSRTRYVHRLVLLAFRGEPPPGHEAAHLNGKRQDNRIRNLKWCTHRENQLHKRAHRTNAHKLTEEQVRAILRSPLSGAEVGRLYGISKTTVSRIRRGLVWGHVREVQPARAPRLSADDVREIRRSKKSHEQLSARYGVSARHIRYIRERRRWRNV